MKIGFWVILKYFGMVAGGLATLYGVFCFFDGMKDDITDIKVTQIEYKATTDTLLNITKTFDQRIQNNKDNIAFNRGQGEVVIKSYLEHLQNDDRLTKEEFVEYMNPFLEYIKKNSSPTVFNNRIPSQENGDTNIIGIGKEPLSSSQ